MTKTSSGNRVLGNVFNKDVLICISVEGDTCMEQGHGVRDRSRGKGHQLIKVEKSHINKSCHSCPKEEEAVKASPEPFWGLWSC